MPLKASMRPSGVRVPSTLPVAVLTWRGLAAWADRAIRARAAGKRRVNEVMAGR